MSRISAVLLAIVGGGAAALLALMVFVGGFLGFLWLFVFGDDPWPHWAEVSLNYAIPVVGLFLWPIRACRKTVPTPSQTVVLVVRFERKPRMLCEQLFTKDPVRVGEGILRQLFGVGILNDRTDLNVRKGEGLGHVLKAFGLDDGFVERLTFKLGDGAV